MTMIEDPDQSVWETDGGAIPDSDPAPVTYPCILCKGPCGVEDVLVDLSDGLNRIHYSVCRSCQTKKGTSL